MAPELAAGAAINTLLNQQHAVVQAGIRSAALAAIFQAEKKAATALAAKKAAAAAAARPAPAPVTPTPVSTYSSPPALGYYSAAQIGALWLTEGGSAEAEGAAECIAEHESGGNPNAISPTDDRGLWQINGSWGALSTVNPAENARAAIMISHDGTSWSPWTTAPDCVL
jgi:hypothetical protein